MKNLTIKTRLFISYGVIIALAIFMTLVSAVALKSLNLKLFDFLEHPFTAYSNVRVCQTEANAITRHMNEMILNTDKTSYENYKKNINVSVEKINKNLETLNAKYTNEELKNEYTESLKSFITLSTSIVEEIEKGNIPGATNMLLTQSTPAIDNLFSIASNIDNDTILRQDNPLYTSNTDTNLAILLIAAVLIINIIIIILLARTIIKGVLVPIKEIEVVADEMAKGNLNVSIEYNKKNEIGNAMDSMRDMITTLSDYLVDIKQTMKNLAEGNLDITSNVEFKGDFIEMGESVGKAIESFSYALNQISISSDQVTSGSEQVSSGAQALSQGATEQASSIEELAATVNDISAQIKNNAEFARLANEKVGLVGNEVVESNQKMTKMIEAMDNISKSSGEIAKIIKTIEDIAFQTNLLALNAAVEAARAGAAGKGFAVVADEVRNLASKSADASKDTSMLIENSLKAIENGVTLANETAKSLDNVVAGAKEITESIQNITDASANQAQAINQINVGVDQISAVVQTNSATAEEGAAASEELSSQANILKTLVSKFTLKNSSTAQNSNNTNSSLNLEPDNNDYDINNDKY